MRIFLGLDGGGTKTAALIMDADGVVLGRGQGGPGNVANSDDATLRQSVRAATGEACQTAGLNASSARFAGVCAGVAGYSSEPRRNAFRSLLCAEIALEDTASGLELSCRVEPDYVIAYWGASHGAEGIVAIAGTGSVVYGRNIEGQTHREDGLGYLLGDRGSGFHLGLRALRYTLDCMQEGKSDLLSEAVQKHTGTHLQNEIVHWLYSGFSPTKVAALAPMVGELAEAGDTAARSHVAEIARQLRHSVRQTRHKLWLPREAPVYPLGGLWQIGEFFRSEFAEPHWKNEGETERGDASWLDARFNIQPPIDDAAYGAALLAKGDGK